MKHQLYWTSNIWTVNGSVDNMAYVQAACGTAPHLIKHVDHLKVGM
jgi:hypothetical protein